MSYTPKTFGMVLNRFFEVISRNWLKLIGVGVWPSIGYIGIIFAWCGWFFWKMYQLKNQGIEDPDPSMILWSVAGLVPFLFVMILVMAVYMGAIAVATTRLNRGETVTIGSAWQAAFEHWGRYIWLIIRQMIVVVLPVLVVMTFLIGGAAGVIALFNHGGGDNSSFALLIPLVILCYLAAAVYGIFMAIRLSFSFFAAASEDLSASHAMARSWELTQGAFWRIFLVLLLVYAMLYVVQMVLIFIIYFVVIIGVLIAVAAHVNENSPVLPVLIVVGGIFFTVIYSVLFAIMHAAYATALAVLYEDQRMRLDPPIQDLPTAAGQFSS